MLLKKQRVLVLCTGNSARSIMAEALFNSVGAAYFDAVSAGSQPTGKVNPFAIYQLQGMALKEPPRSKSWDEFAVSGAKDIDIVVTVCSNAANEICPTFSGAAQVVHWGLPDPAAIDGSDTEKQQAFSLCFSFFEQRIRALVNLLSEGRSTSVFAAMVEMSALFSANPSVYADALAIEKVSRHATH